MLLEGVGDEVVLLLCAVLAVAAVLLSWTRGAEVDLHDPGDTEGETELETEERDEGWEPTAQEEQANSAAEVAAGRQPGMPQPDAGAGSSGPMPTENGGSTTAAPPGARERIEQDSCPICLEAITAGVVTNCGHSFCGACFVAYWDHVPITRAVTCAVCRQRVTMLLRRSQEAALPAEIEARLHSFNRRFSGEPRSTMEYVRDIPILLWHLWQMLWSEHGIFLIAGARHLIILILSGVFYVLSPFDIIPEAAFGIIGLIDDILVILFFLVMASHFYRGMLISRSQGVG